MDDLNTTRYPVEPPHKKTKKGNSFLTGLFGVIVGAAIVLLVMSNLPENSDVAKTNDDSVQSTEEAERISIDVNTDVTDVVESVATSVVGVTNVQTVRDFWSSSEMTQETGTGSGVIYKKSGDKAYIVSNHHVVEDAEILEITFDDGKKVDGKLIGSDMWTDLAVIEIDSEGVDAVAKFGDSDTLKRGEPVIAIGNPLGLGFAGSVTVGVISGKDRSIPVDFDNDNIADWHADVLQTDAAINPGNSGGALINMAGQLVGINSMKISQATVEGIGLAIPINLAAPIIEKLEVLGEVIRPTMGVSLLDLSIIPVNQHYEVLQLPEDVASGVVVTEVARSSPAAVAGLTRYDVIVEMDGEEINDMVDLRKHLYNEKEIGDEMIIKIYRQGKLIEVNMLLENKTTL